MKSVTKTFKALSDTNRLRILKMLEVKPLCVCEITDILQLAPSTVSKHLSLLRDAGFINDTKDGKWVNYELSPVSIAAVLAPFISEWLKDEKIILQDKEKIAAVDRIVICSAENK